MGMSCVFVALLCAPLVGMPGIVVAELTHLMDQEVEKAILAEEWSKVADLLDSDDSLTSASVARLIKGHACLALNRNNESLELFLNASSAEDLERWEEWTLGFAEQNPHNAVVHYLKGDAFARMEQWDSAILAFDKALQIKPDYPLALNARGVALCACGRWDGAEADFERVCQGRVAEEEN